jgi:hypothetical protein
MQLRTFGTWTGSISGIGAGALMASPDYQYLAIYVALASAAVWAGMLVLFLVSNHREIRSGIVKLGSWYFILPCLALAVLGIAGAAYGFGLRASLPIDVANKGDAAAPTAQMQQTSAPPTIKDAYIDWDKSGRVSLRGRFVKSDGPVSIYVTYGSISRSPGFPQVRDVVSGKFLNQPRIKIGSIPHFDNEESADITIGTISNYEGNQQVIEWGEPEQKNSKVGVTWANYFCFVILVWRDGREEFYPFAIVTKSHASSDGSSAIPEAPAVFGPDVITAHWQMSTDKK